jgi:hypothetical protein
MHSEVRSKLFVVTAFLAVCALAVVLSSAFPVTAEAQQPTMPASPAAAAASTSPGQGYAYPKLQPAPLAVNPRGSGASPTSVPGLGTKGNDVVVVSHTLPDGTDCVFMRYGPNVAASCDFRRTDR